MSTNKSVYLVELNYDFNIRGYKAACHCVIGVYGDLDMAIERALKNSDDNQTIDDIRNAMKLEGMCEICQKPFPAYPDDNLFYYPSVIISEHPLMEKE